jgi:hypothetical protein
MPGKRPIVDERQAAFATGEKAMRRFVHGENIKHLRGVLDRATNDDERRSIRALLAEEEAKLREAEQQRWQEGFSDSSVMHVACGFCRRSMAFWRFQEMDIKGKGRFLAAILLCDKCNSTQLVLGDKPLGLNRAAE